MYTPIHIYPLLTVHREINSNLVAAVPQILALTSTSPESVNSAVSPAVSPAIPGPAQAPALKGSVTSSPAFGIAPWASTRLTLELDMKYPTARKTDVAQSDGIGSFAATRPC